MRKNIFLAIVQFLLFANVYSQNDDYVITVENDTIYGSITGLSGKFTPNGTKIKKHINSNEVIEFYNDSTSEYYELIKSPYTFDMGKHMFFKRIVSGRIKLYSQSTGGAMTMGTGGMITTAGGSTDYIVSKDNSQPIFINTRKKDKEVNRELFQDDYNLAQEFDSLKGTFKNLLSIIRKYNNHKRPAKEIQFSKPILTDTILIVNPCSDITYSVSDKKLRKKTEKKDEPDISPIFQGGIKKELKKFVTSNFFENIYNSEWEFVVKVGFLVNCEGKAGNFMELTKGRHEPMISYIKNVNKIANNMPDKWRAAEVNGIKVDSFQVLTFTIQKGELIGVSYK